MTDNSLAEIARSTATTSTTCRHWRTCVVVCTSDWHVGACVGGIPVHHALGTRHPSHPCATQDVGWPLNLTNYPRASMLCAELLALPETLRVHTYALPRSITFPGLLSTVAPYFNRGYPVEAYTLQHLRHGPFTEHRIEAANAFLIPVAPYAMRVAAYPGDGLVTVQHRVAAAVDAVKQLYPGPWMGRNGCDQVLVSAHDKGGRVAQLADFALINRGVLVVNTADTHGNADEWGRYTPGKDVAGVCSFSISLPMWSAHLETCGNSSTAAARTVTASFVGGGLGSVRQGLFKHLDEQPWEELTVLHGHIAPMDYMRLLRTSKFCLVRAYTSAWCVSRARTHSNTSLAAREGHPGAEPPPD